VNESITAVDHPNPQTGRFQSQRISAVGRRQRNSQRSRFGESGFNRILPDVHHQRVNLLDVD
jgi:hypothetical protein